MIKFTIFQNITKYWWWIQLRLLPPPLPAYFAKPKVNDRILESLHFALWFYPSQQTIRTDMIVDTITCIWLLIQSHACWYNHIHIDTITYMYIYVLVSLVLQFWEQMSVGLFNCNLSTPVTRSVSWHTTQFKTLYPILIHSQWYKTPHHSWEMADSSILGSWTRYKNQCTGTLLIFKETSIDIVLIGL